MRPYRRRHRIIIDFKGPTDPPPFLSAEAVASTFMRELEIRGCEVEHYQDALLDQGGSVKEVVFPRHEQPPPDPKHSHQAITRKRGVLRPVKHPGQKPKKEA